MPDLDEVDDEDEEEKDDLDSEEEDEQEEEMAKEDAGNDKDQKSWGRWSKKIWGDASDQKLVQSLRQEGEKLVSLITKGRTTVYCDNAV